MNKQNYLDEYDDRIEEFLTQHNTEELSTEDENGMQFLVLENPVQRDDRPLVIWIHPGDACEYDNPEREVVENAHDFERYMGEEILSRGETHRLIVLHRQSTPYAFDHETDRVHEEYQAAMGMALCKKDTVHLWGDDLNAAGEWLTTQFTDAPAFFLTGAWSDPEHGCVAHVGKILIKTGKPVQVSMWSPSEPGSVANVWRPEEEQSKLELSLPKMRGTSPRR